MSSFFDKVLKLPVLVHLMAAGILTCVIIFFVLKGLDVYTNHNQAVIVPDVRKLQIEDAIPFFQKNFLKYEIIDSVYAEGTPGSIYRLVPEANSTVKKNRIVYITIISKSEETAVIPDIADISYREALAQLRQRGFSDIERKEVTGEYRDLTVGVEYGGKMMSSGVRVPLKAKLILVVSDGNKSNEDTEPVSEEEIDEESGESWF